MANCESEVELMCFWKFEITGYGSDIGEYNYTGLIWGKNYTEAVSALEAWYGDEICTLKIEPIREEGEPYLLNE